MKLCMTLILPLSALLASLGEVGVAVGLPCCLVILAGVAGLWVDWSAYRAARAFLEDGR